jgi:16S rRNA (cytosine1402-N4)-methyltransferase
MNKNAHISVMLEELVDAVLTDPNGIYIDATFGRGGHARALLARLGPSGRLIAVDQDLAAHAAVDADLQHDPRFSLHHISFAHLLDLVRELGVAGKVTGIMADLGVSSPQLDQAERGFSFLHDGPLDMRMNTQSGLTAAEWLATVSEAELADVLWRFGDENFSRRIAKAIIISRAVTPIVSTVQLAEIIKHAHPKWPKHHHPATKSFQAIRIFINQELSALADMLQQVDAVLAVDGMLAILSFHSLEDRIVKQFLKSSRGIDVPANIPLTEEMLQQYNAQQLKMISSKTPVAAEIAINPRSRSARLRVAKKIR